MGLFSASILSILPFFAIFIYYKNFSTIIFTYAAFLFFVLMIRELLKDLENIPYVSQITQFHSNFSMNNNALHKLKTEEEINNAIQTKREEAEQTYALRLKVFLQ